MNSDPRGLTLFEILIALAIVVVLLAMIIPAWINFSNRVSDEILQTTFVNAINLARQKSQSSNTPVIICKSMDLKSCSGDWSDGLLIFKDEKNDGIAHEERQIVARIPLHTKGKVYMRSYPAYRDSLLFMPTNLMANDDGTFWFCAKNNTNPSWAVTFNRTGITRVLYPNFQGLLLDSHGQPLNCH